MRYFIIAGEPSGDIHGANLIKAIKQVDADANFAFWGGDQMQKEANTKPLKHISELAFMGFVEVLLNLKTILTNFKLCKHQIGEYQPNAVIFIDYPGFNLRMAKWAKQNQLKTIYYISPQIWAWKENRVNTIKTYVDQMICILPFELDFYKKHGVHAHYVGHPLLDAIDNLPLSESKRKGIALLPGSRKQEIKKMLPTMLKVAASLQYQQFIIGAAPSISKQYYQSFTLTSNVKIAYGKTQEIMRQSEAALVTSGTATLETALFETPLVVCYKASAISVAIARRLIKVKFISLVNLITDKEIVKELIQNDYNAKNLQCELQNIMNGPKRKTLQNEFIELKKLLGNKGASKRAADIIYSTVKTNL